MKQLSWKQVGVMVLLVLGLILAFSPIESSKVSQEDTIRISKMIVEREDHITAEQLGSLIVDKDPDYILLDIRDSEEYEKYHIKTALNYPLKDLFKADVLEELDPEKLIILYSNGGTHAAQAWVLLHEKGLTNSAVLLGGLNYWVEVYSNPDPPAGVYADSEVFRYQFLKAAGKYLMGEKEIVDEQPTKQEPVKVKPFKRKKKKKGADEGC